jgi:hypothetical protein
MTDRNPDREKLAELIEIARMPSGGTLLGSRVQFEAIADAILASDWLAQVRREAAAEALDDAADAIEKKLVYDHTTLGMSSQDWLYARATAIREQGTE